MQCRRVNLLLLSTCDTERTGYLIVAQAQTSDSGVYKCLASNPLGNATAPARVVVTGMLSDIAHLYTGKQVQAGLYLCTRVA